MKNKLTEILKFLINIEECFSIDHIPKIEKDIGLMKIIADHEDECFINLPDNMMFGKRGQTYIQNSSDLNVASKLISDVANKLKSGKKSKEFSVKIYKARTLVKNCIDR